MSWNPTPTLGSANWQGNPQVATKNQLLSSVTGIENQIDALSFSTISTFKTLYVTDWISSGEIYVSTIHAQNIDLSGIALDASGIFNTQIISTTTNITALQILSSLEFKAPVINNNFSINVSFNVKDAVSGFFTGLGFLIFETLLGLGAGIGAAAQGIGNGIAAMIMARGTSNTYINNNTFELIGGSTQLQVSTIGNAYPLYSSITRFVSSVSGNSVPGPEIFISTFFQPGQICIRSISDPFPMVTGDSNLNTSTIQQFGQWVPLTGLEPENLVGNSLSTNSISSGQAYIGSNSVYLQSVLGGQSNAYNAPILFNTGATNSAKIIGYNQNLYLQTSQGFIFTQPNTSVENASLYLGTGAKESLLNISSINAVGNINANTANISSLLVTNLTVISSFSTINNVFAFNTFSTNEITANLVSTYVLDARSINPFSLSTPFGYNDSKVGPYSILRNDTVVSTMYDQVSSLTQNILQSQLNVAIQDQTANVVSPLTLVTPSNVEQWASTIMIWNDFNVVGNIDLGYVQLWSSPTTTVPSGTFDVYVKTEGESSVNQMTVRQNTNRYNPLLPSTFFQTSIQTAPFFQSWRFTLEPNNNGWWTAVSPAPPPYATVNSNALSIWQDINDTYIEGTDRLHLKAGDIFLDGVTNLGTVNTLTAGQVITSNLVSCNANVFVGQFSTLTTSNWISTPQVLSPYNYIGGFNDVPTYTPTNITYNIQSTDFSRLATLTNASRGWNGFSYQNLNEWNNTQYNTANGVTTTDLPVVIVGETYSNAQSNSPPVPYSGQFWINNTTSGTTASFFPVQSIKPGGQGILSTIGIASRNGTGYTRVYTNDGSNWAVQTNVPNPQGNSYSLSNAYKVQVGKQNTTLTVNQPYIESVPSKQVYAEKVVHNVPQMRIYTNASPSFQSREAGIEYSTYFDQNIIFTGSQSDSFNLIRNPLGNLYYPYAGWTAMIWLSRIRTKSLGIQGFEVSGQFALASGTAGDYVWGSARYLNVNDSAPVVIADDTENYLMIPTNYMTFPTFLPG